MARSDASWARNRSCPPATTGGLGRPLLGNAVARIATGVEKAAAAVARGGVTDAEPWRTG